MPHPDFKVLFFTPHPVVTPVASNSKYFIPGDIEDTAKQLREFKASEGFSNFKKEYEDTLDALNRWCIGQGIHRLISEDMDDTLTASFDLFKSRLFGTESYYSLREALLFSVGKKSLERLLSLLGQTHISTDSKKNVLINLQESIGLCADGAATNIMDAADDLGAFLGIYAQMDNIKRILIQQQALLFVRKQYGETQGNEIHFVNAYYNHVAPQYGLLPREDTFITALKIRDRDLSIFSDILQAQLTPEMVLQNLILTINQELITLRQKLSNQLFTQRKKQAFDKPFQQILEKILAEWNQRYAALVPCDRYTLISLTESGKECSLAAHNEAWVYAQITQRFRALFLAEHCQKITFKINETDQLVFDTGVFWIEQEEEYGICSPEIFARITPPSDTALREKSAYFAILNKLSSIFPDNASIIQIASQQNSVDLIKYNCSAILNYLFAQKLISYDVVATDINNIWHLIFNKEFVLVKQLLNKGMITQAQLSVVPEERFAAGKNCICLLILDNQFSLVEQLLAEGLINQDQLNLSIKEGTDAGANSVWLLVAAQQFQLLADLVMDNLITPQMFLAAPTQGPNAGVNSVWFLTNKKQYELLLHLVKSDLITPEMLLSAPTQGPNAGVISVLFLAANRQYELLAHLAARGLITSELFLVAISHGPLTGVNSVWLITKTQQYGLLEYLLKRELITSEMLLAAPTQGADAGINSVWILIADKQYDLLIHLIKKSLVTSKILLAQATEGLAMGINCVWLLVADKQYDLLIDLIKNDLITSEMLFAAPTQGPNAGINSILSLAAFKQTNVLQQLLEKNLITREQFETSLSLSIEGIKKIIGKRGGGHFFAMRLAQKDEEKQPERALGRGA